MTNARALEFQILQRMMPLSVPAPISRALSSVLGLGELTQIAASPRGAVALPEKLLTALDIRYRVSEQEIARIPVSGPCVLVVNHPFGIVDGALLATLLKRVRPDVRFLANHALTSVPELSDLLIPVDPWRRGSNAGGARKALRFLQDGGLLVVFPAGEVSHFQWREGAVADPSWSTGVVQLIAFARRRGIEPQLVPAFVAGRNSLLFQIVGILHPHLRTMLLGREALNKRHSEIELRIGAAISSSKLLALKSNTEQIDYLRWRTGLLAERQSFKPRTAWPLRRSTQEKTPVIAPVAAQDLRSEIAALGETHRLIRSGEYEVYCAPASGMPRLLREIGRLRETTFRRAGEGTGHSVDLDRFDEHYQHLFLWNREKREIAGAYRLCETERAAPHRLYTATLFNYGSAFLTRMGPAIELGRSFVREEYQRSFAPLLLLWKGIGRYISRRPHCKTLFGPVSISNGYQAISKRLMMSFLERESLLREWTALVSPKNPPGHHRTDVRCADIEELSSLIAGIEPSGAGVPVLLRHYLKLGGKLLGFSSDPHFSGTLDGLIVVDLTKTQPNLRERYLGRGEAAQFLAFHRKDQ